MKNKNGKRGTLHCAIVTVLFISLTLNAGCSGENPTGVTKSGDGDTKLIGKEDAPGAETENETTDKVNEATEGFTTDRNFAPNLVYATMNREKGWAKQKYTTEDFPEFRFEKVEELTAWELVWRQLEAEKTGNNDGLKDLINRGMLIDLDKYQRILILTVEEKSKKNVVAAINYLLKRDDVQKAEPSYLPWPTEPGTTFPGLDAETEKQIMQYLFNEFVKNDPDNWRVKEGMITADTFKIQRYYGTYNGYVVIVPSYSAMAVMWIMDIDGIVFTEASPPGITAWKDGGFHDLKDIYEKGLLKREDLLAIAGEQKKVQVRTYADIKN